MTHLTPDELIDAMEGPLAPEWRAHLDVCDACRGQLDALTATLHDAKQASIPEPSPLFWNHFSTRVNLAIDEETPRAATWSRWLRWQVLLPIGAAAVLVLGLLMTMPLAKRAAVANAVADAAPAAADLSDESWNTVADIVGHLDVETASAAGVIEPGVADQAVLELTAEEQQELTRLLQAELTRAKS